jgi:hypothetical protein
VSRVALVRQGGFVHLVRQFADVMTLAGEEEKQRAESEHETGFAKKRSHKVRHSKRRALRGARRKMSPLLVLVIMLVLVLMLEKGRQLDHEREHDYEEGTIAN